MNLTVINYHYFRETTYPDGIFPTSRNKLIQDVDFISKKFVFISQNELNDYFSGKGHLNYDLKKKYCLLTWDDGLSEQMEAFDILQNIGVPALFFVNTKPYFDNKLLDVHKLHIVRSLIPDKRIIELLKAKYNFDQYKFNKNLLEIQYRYDNQDAKQLKYFLNFVLNKEDKEEVINIFFKECIDSEEEFCKKFYMSNDDLVKLSLNDSLGSHGHSHHPIGKMSLEDGIYDINSSIQYLELITNKKIISFAYPYGSPDAIGDKTSLLFDNTSIRFIFNMTRGQNIINTFSKCCELKRFDNNDINTLNV